MYRWPSILHGGIAGSIIFHTAVHIQVNLMEQFGTTTCQEHKTKLNFVHHLPSTPNLALQLNYNTFELVGLAITIVCPLAQTRCNIEHLNERGKFNVNNVCCNMASL